LNKDSSQAKICARELLSYIDKAPTQFHAVTESAEILETNGFQRLYEKDAWKLTPGGKYYVVRNSSSLIAFTLGTDEVESAGFHIVGAHTDSPNLRLKPNPEYEKSGYGQLGVEPYGGVLLASWTDRDLSLAGRVFVRNEEDETCEKLVCFENPLLRISQLTIHLNRNVNENGLILNKQTHLPPIFTMAGGSSKSNLNQLLAGRLQCETDQIVGFDLALYDTQKGSLGGLNEEFIFSSQLDDLASCHAGLKALVDSPESTKSTRVLALHDHEEVGSASAQGAESLFLKDVLERIVGSSKPREDFFRALSQSFCISADMAHAVHPNYSDLHDIRHMPIVNQGPVLKMNVNQKYATDGATGMFFENLCKEVEIPLQKFVIRSDLMCGSTIGPITATTLGIPTVDVGNPMLSMHSIREMSGTTDHANMVTVLKHFYSI
jgi:aspartyl aminopeptidase